MKVKLDRATDSVTVFSDTETSPHVTATAALVDAEPAPVHDLAAVRARCTRRVEQFQGYSHQPFMDFGPRWGSLRSIEYGDGEAVVTTEFPAAVRGRARRPVAAPGADGHPHGQRPGADPRLHPGRDVLRAVLVRPRARRGDRCRSGPSATSASATASANDLATFDISITDEHGDEAVAIESFTMRRISGATALTSLRRTDIADRRAGRARVDGRLGDARGHPAVGGRRRLRPHRRLRPRRPGRGVVGRRRAVDGQGRRRGVGRPTTTPPAAVGRSTSGPTSAPTSCRRRRRSSGSWRRCGGRCSASSGSVAMTTSSSSAGSR